DTTILREEIARLAALPEPWEGLDFERLVEEINQRLADDKERSQQLVDRIRAASERSILFFANSVRHAEEIAARLTLGGVPAAVVSGDTPGAVRRHFLEAFHRGELRVLCNHSVLTTG